MLYQSSGATQWNETGSRQMCGIAKRESGDGVGASALSLSGSGELAEHRGAREP
ncbi:MAG: hypothetical protein ACKO24_11955 [Leptolyngbyaceae cyanobacterium]